MTACNDPFHQDRDRKGKKEKLMQALEFETKIDKAGRIFLPAEFQHAYGKSARLLVLLPDQAVAPKKRRQPGSAQGTLKILFEDDDHLNDFKAYMP
jgi:hypothetical protein